MRRDERDELFALDWSKVYANVPGAVDDGVRIAFMRIRESRRRRLRTLRIAACAACAVIAVGAAALLLRGGGSAPDRVVPLAPEAVTLTDDSVVYASREDAHFHLKADCARAEGETVALKYVTAREFEKTACSACGASIVSNDY